MRRMHRAMREFRVLGAIALLGAPICAQVTQRVSLDSVGAQGNADSGYFGLSVSADGRHVAFQSFATNLVPGGTHGYGNVFERDPLTGQTSLVSLASNGAHVDGASLTAPDLDAGDPGVSARSAAEGDVIQPGESGWYLVYYRDPTVLGGCPSRSTFNATQTGSVDWSLKWMDRSSHE